MLYGWQTSEGPVTRRNAQRYHIWTLVVGAGKGVHVAGNSTLS
jgi:hypothetical protein